MHGHGHDQGYEPAATPDEWACYLAGAVPGADTAAVLQVLDAEKLSHAGRIDALQALERHLAWIQAQQAHLLAALHLEVEAAVPTGWNREVAGQWEYAADEVACALKISGATAAGRLHVARELAGRLPTTLGMLERGEVSWMQAKAMVEITDVLDPQVAGEVEAVVAPGMGVLACGQTRRALNRAVARIDPEGARDRHLARRREREITHREAGDGMALWGAYLPAEQAAQLDAAIDAHAETLREEDECRTLIQRRVDALVDLVVNRTGSTAGSGGRSGAVVQVTVPIDVLLGVSQEPGELKGYGPVTAGQVREVAFARDVVWRRLLTDPGTGVVVKTDPVTYKPTAETARHVIARDGVCMFPSCQMPAHRCDLDHVVPFDHHDPHAGGATTPDNLIPLCRHHHQLKHQTDWNVERDTTTGTVTWTAPTGHRYTTHPHNYREQTANPVSQRGLRCGQG